MEPLHEIPGPAGALEARLELPAGTPRAVAVIAHPHTQYGGTLQTRAVYEAARAFTRIGVVSLRFNFRGAGVSRGTFDDGRGEQDDYRAALDYAAARFPGLPLWAAGMSFGAWVATTVGATDPRVTLLLAIAPAVDHYAYDALKHDHETRLRDSRRGGRACPGPARPPALRRDGGAEGARGHRRRRPRIRRADVNRRRGNRGFVG